MRKYNSYGANDEQNAIVPFVYVENLNIEATRVNDVTKGQINNCKRGLVEHRHVTNSFDFCCISLVCVLLMNISKK